VLEPAFGVPARRPTVSVPARLAVVLKAAVGAPARPDGAAVPDPAAYGVYPLVILIVYVIVTGGILCSDESEVYLTTNNTAEMCRLLEVIREAVRERFFYATM